MSTPPPLVTSLSASLALSSISKKVGTRCRRPSYERFLESPRRTPHGAPRLVQATPAWLVKTRHASSRHSRVARVLCSYDYSHAQTESPPPPPCCLSGCATCTQKSYPSYCFHPISRNHPPVICNKSKHQAKHAPYRWIPLDTTRSQDTARGITRKTPNIENPGVISYVKHGGTAVVVLLYELPILMLKAS